MYLAEDFECSVGEVGGGDDEVEREEGEVENGRVDGGWEEDEGHVDFGEEGEVGLEG